MSADINTTITPKSLPELATVVAVIAKHIQADGKVGDQIKDIREVDAGSSFVVIKERKENCANFEEPHVVAVKQLVQPMLMIEEDLIQDARTALRVPPHPNLLLVVRWIRQPSFSLITLQVELMAGPQGLQNTMSTPQDRFILIKDASAGLYQLQDHRIIHGAFHEGNDPYMRDFQNREFNYREAIVWIGGAFRFSLRRRRYLTGFPSTNEILPRAYLRTYNVVPELKAQPALRMTTETDIYLLGILAYNVFTQGVTRNRLRRQGWTAMHAMLVILDKCLSPDPELRPDILDIVAGLRKD